MSRMMRFLSSDRKYVSYAHPPWCWWFLWLRFLQFSLYSFGSYDFPSSSRSTASPGSTAGVPKVVQFTSFCILFIRSFIHCLHVLSMVLCGVPCPLYVFAENANAMKRTIKRTYARSCACLFYSEPLSGGK